MLKGGPSSPELEYMDSFRYFSSILVLSIADTGLLRSFFIFHSRLVFVELGFSKLKFCSALAKVPEIVIHW